MQFSMFLCGLEFIIFNSSSYLPVTVVPCSLTQPITIAISPAWETSRGVGSGPTVPKLHLSLESAGAGGGEEFKKQ